jgi:hypothetical protein
VGADFVQPRARAGRRTGGRGPLAGAAADPQRDRHRGVRGLVGVVCRRGVDRRADHRQVRPGPRGRARPDRLPRAPGRGVRRATRRRRLGHRGGDGHRHRPGGGRPADPGLLVAGHLRGAGAGGGAGGAGGARRAGRTGARVRPPSSGRAGQPDPGPAVGRTHGRVVPAGAAPGRGMAALTGGGGVDRVRRTGGGPRRPPPRPAPATAGPGRGRRRLLPDRRRSGRPGAPAVVGPRVDDRAPGPDRSGPRPDRRPPHLAGDGDASAARRARGLDHRCATRRCGGGAGDPDANLHHGPARCPGAGAGGDHLTGARRPAAAAGQDRDLAGAGRGVVGAEGPGPGPTPRPAAELEGRLDAQLERAATRAFRDSFLVGAGLAALAMVIVLLPRGRRRQ